MADDGGAPAEGRSRRANAGKGRTGAAAKSALEELRALKADGGKGRRAATFEVKEAPTVYDVVDEKDYAEVVARRRREGGGFLEDDVGDGYADVGEEIDWTVEEGDDPSANLPQKRKGKSTKDSKRSKSSAAAEFDPAGRKKMQSLLMAGSVSNRPSKPVTDAESDDLLNDILSGLGGAEAQPSAAPSRGAQLSGGRSKPAAPPSSGFTRVPAGAAARITSKPSQASSQAAQPRAGGSGTALARPPKTFSRQPRPQAAPKQSIQQALDEFDELLADDPVEEQEEDVSAPPPPEEEDEEMAPVEDEAVELAAEDVHEAPAAAAAAAAEEAQEDDMKALLEEDVDEEEEKKEADKRSAAAGGGKGALVEEDEETGVAAGWAELCGEEDEDAWDQEAEETGDVAMDAAEETPFFLLDVHEEFNQPGVAYLFGKVAHESRFVSACCVVKDMVRSIVVVPKEGVLSDSSGRLDQLQEEFAKDPTKKRDLVIHLQQMAAELKKEVKEVLAVHGVTRTTISVVQRSYAFEDPRVPHGKQWVLKVKYAADQGKVPHGLQGKHFSAILGCSTSTTEALLVKRKIMGPSWITLWNARPIDKQHQVSYCAVEVEVNGPKAVVTGGEVENRPVPPLTVASLHVKTHVNPSSHTNEIIAAGVVSLTGVKIDGPTQRDEWNTPKRLRNFSVVRKLNNNPWPVGFQSKVDTANGSAHGKRNSAGGPMISLQTGERALLCFLLARLQALDADVFVGHNIAGFDIDVLLHRLQHHKVPHWSRIGRLKRSRFPNLSGGGNVFGGGASNGALTCLSGRLLCDTYLAGREFVKEVDYTLGTLSKNLLGEQRSEPPQAERSFESSETLMSLVECTGSDAWLAMGLMFHLNVLPLTRQLTCLSGFLWARTLSGARAQRIEMLLLHEFHRRKFITPDKLTNKEKVALAKLRGGDAAELEQGKKSKGPQYAGGLVLEPKKGLYEKYILMLDFNSLYPSIIQEYNICFTTVDRPEDGTMAPLPESASELAPLPLVIQKLVQRRRQVKDLLKREQDSVRKEQLNVRQQALKLTANSMYGCLGFGSSRFYCKPLAELITSQGREILQSTVDLVQTNMGMDVIYGDTDSIMINTNTENLPDVWKMGQAVKKQVNKRYTLLEIEVDGVYKSMLLLKKKKYAAMKVELLPSGEVKQEMEQKGLDIVRRDWCLLSKDCGNFALKRILSGDKEEDVVDSIHAHLKSVRETVHNGQVQMNKFVITKQLTKQPEDYPDAKNQPHVQVALRRKAQGKRNGVAAGETVPYIICVDKSSEDAQQQQGKSMAERAYHPEEIKGSDTLAVDIEYYLGQQVHPVVSRLCGPITGTDPGHLADCLGLDPTRYRGAATMAGDNAEMREELDHLAGGSLLDDPDTYKDCEPLWLTAAPRAGEESQGVKFRLPAFAAKEVASGGLSADSILRPAESLAPLTPAQLANQAALASRAAVSAYYAAPARSEEEMSSHETRDVSLRTVGAAAADGGSSAMVRTVTEASLYTQLSSFALALDTAAGLNAAAGAGTDEAEAFNRLSPLSGAFKAAFAAVEKLRSRCVYKWVDLNSLFGGSRDRSSGSVVRQLGTV